jgi:hypothetical protein
MSEVACKTDAEYIRALEGRLMDAGIPLPTREPKAPDRAVEALRRAIALLEARHVSAKVPEMACLMAELADLEATPSGRND